jgi:hypothetical protein
VPTQKNIREYSVTATGEEIKINKNSLVQTRMSFTVSSAKNLTSSVWEKQSINKKRATAHRISVNNAQENKKKHLQEK